MAKITVCLPAALEGNIAKYFSEMANRALCGQPPLAQLGKCKAGRFTYSEHVSRAIAFKKKKRHISAVTRGPDDTCFQNIFHAQAPGNIPPLTVADVENEK
ncbi:hypothetical protein CDAR_473771 [Caerostris darwini]|uniref:Uncharacterized protein n=1 Tax=Caerostris darwini TaxID=1538125 RepID=A0AAV4SD79_9ARAC|nr:hypothetical protein CDAR_473771 [Caerostris darwini]